MAKKVLVTGFEAFGGESINPTERILQQLLSEEWLTKFEAVGISLYTQLLPVVRYESLKICKQKIEAVNPDIVLMLGQAAGRDKISFEKVAINHDDFRIPDNNGNQPIDEPIIDGGQEAFFSALPLKAMTKALNQADIPAEISYTAGTFVCNHLFYGISHYLATEHPGSARCDFVHVPLLPQQRQCDSQPCMPLADMVKGLYEALACAAHQQRDLKITAGTIC
ncbi:pyroglutamyl-peptidase I [Photobacterium sanctipauli]|uniref:Pyroglutamyl-peptidase I n=1 Tax=Photobacterium sanctipauli TaxID=1342794 RepID=A0A2T3NYZ0_9GAMM|nr:pyroglutamyl-peptidase I [Photobacterium sanctipauli]PSW21496.1 pyroglutamyl-peptidase I [Photobacterium sanctipauli]